MGTQITVYLHGGPRDGDQVKYLTPLPEILCVAVKMTKDSLAYYDYKYRNDKGRKGPHEYDYVGRTGCQKNTQ